MCTGVRITAFVSLILLSFGCGGGTTGTSSTDSLKVGGIATDSGGMPESIVEVVAFDADSQREVASTRTDEDGTFELRVPDTTHTFSVKIGSAVSAPMTRGTQGDAEMPARVTVVSEKRAEVDYFEAKVDEGSLCPQVSFDGTRLQISDLSAVSGCDVAVQIHSASISLDEFQVGIIGICNEIPTILQTGSVSGAGVARVAIGSLNSSCTGIQLVIFPSSLPLIQFKVPIEVG